MAPSLQLHVRENNSLLAEAERRALLWMARRMPACVNSDHLTLLGLSAMLLAGLGYWAAGRNKWALLVVVAGLGLNWLGDSLDGTLARVRNRQRPRYGFYVDHVVDLVGTTFLLCGLALSGFMTPLVAVGVLAAFVLVEAEVLLATHVRQVFRLSFGGFGPTELRVLLGCGTLVLLVKPWVFLGTSGPYRLFDVGGIVAIAAMVSVLTISAVRNARALYRAETDAPCAQETEA